MNTHNPLIPQGSLPDSRGKSHVRIAVFTILAIHVLLLGALLMAGCKKTNDNAAGPGNAGTADVPPVLPPLTSDSNLPPVGAGVATPPPATGNLAAPTPPPAAPVNPIPAPPPMDNTVAAAPVTEHTIVKGETLGALAKKYHTTVAAIKEANPGVDPTKLGIGKKVKIPAPSATAAATGAVGNGATTAAGPNGEATYKVKSGDNLWTLAKHFDVKVEALRNANGLKAGEKLRVGRMLKIPAKGAAGAPDSTPVGTSALSPAGATTSAPPTGAPIQ